MGKFFRMLLIVIILPLEMISAMLREIGSAVRMMVSVWEGDNFFDATFKEMNRRIEHIKSELEKAKDLAARLRGGK